MIMSLYALLRRLIFIVLFLMMTYALIHLLDIMRDWVFPADKYRQPLGKAMKVFQLKDGLEKQQFSFVERLRLYYWLGE